MSNYYNTENIDTTNRSIYSEFPLDNYLNIDTLENINISDSFVFRSQKIGNGSGEKKLYVGQKSKKLYDFFGGEGFKIECMLTKSNLSSFLLGLKDEYKHSNNLYINKEKLPSLYSKRIKKINNLSNDLLFFDLVEKNNIKGPRLYVTSEDNNYNIIREISLPKICFLNFKKFKNNDRIIYQIVLQCRENIIEKNLQKKKLRIYRK